MSIFGLLLLYILRFAVDWYEVHNSNQLQKTANLSRDRLDDIRKQVFDLRERLDSFDSRFLAIENELKLRKADSRILTEWLDKRDLELIRVEAEFIKALKIEQRQQDMERTETKILQLSENLRLITTRKK